MILLDEKEHWVKHPVQFFDAVEDVMDVYEGAHERQMVKQILQPFGLKRNRNVNIYASFFLWGL